MARSRVPEEAFMHRHLSKHARVVLVCAIALAPLGCAADAGEPGGSTANDDLAIADEALVIGETGVGAGVASYVCPSGAITIPETQEDVSPAINAAPAGATICIVGVHRASATLVLKDGQTLIGIGSRARIKGSVPLEATGWHRCTSCAAGVWYYDGPSARLAGQPHRKSYLTSNMNHPACYPVSTYQDDVFYGGRRMMRVLAVSQLTGTSLPAGQRVTEGEYGRFFFDYAAHRIYIDRDPTGVAVDVAALGDLIDGHRASHVTIQNLSLERALENIIGLGTAKSWHIVDSTIRFAHNEGIQGGGGLSPTDRMVVLRTLVTSNGQYAMSSGVSWTRIESSEFSWNNIANYRQGTGGVCEGYSSAGTVKFVNVMGTPTQAGLEVLDLDSHHNVGDGFWTDIHNQYVSVIGGRYHDNERNGYFHEIGCDIEIAGAEFDHNGVPIKNSDVGGGGIAISTSNNGDIHDNLVHDNPGGISLTWHGSHQNMLGVPCMTATNDTDTSDALRHNRVHGNDVYMCRGQSGQHGGGFTLAQRDNSFEGDAFHVPDTTGKWWVDGSSQTWTSWRAAGHDDTGSRDVGCVP